MTLLSDTFPKESKKEDEMKLTITIEARSRWEVLGILKEAIQAMFFPTVRMDFGEKPWAFQMKVEEGQLTCDSKWEE